MRALRYAVALAAASAVGFMVAKRLGRECPHCGDRFCPVYFAGVE